MATLFRTFISDKRGNTAMIFALVMLPILVLIGIAFDSSRLQATKNHLANASDATALTAARAFGDGDMTKAEIEALAATTFKIDMATAHSDAKCGAPNITFDEISFKVTVSADCELPTTFAGLVGQEKFELTTSSTALANKSRLDLMMMLDVSGSMAGDKLTALQNAAHGAVDALITDPTSDKVRIGPRIKSVRTCIG